MAITGFPTNIDVTLGSAWAGRFGMDPSDVVSLTKISGQDKWSEDGTTTVNTTTNRLMLSFSHGSVDGVDIGVINWFTGSNFTYEVQLFLTTGQANNGTIYTWKDVFDDTQTNININHNFSPSFMSNFTGVQTDYNASFFSAIEEAGAAATIDPTGIASAEAFGTAFVMNGIVDPTGIASAEAFGSHQVNLTIFPTGIASSEAFGLAFLEFSEIIATGIPSAEAFGTTSLIIDSFHQVTGIPSEEAFGAAFVLIKQYFGSGVITLGQNIFFPALTTYEIFIDLDSTWDVFAILDVDQDFEWNTGEATLFYYRIETACALPPECAVQGFESDEECVDGQSLFTTVAARNLADLCTKLKELFLNVPSLWPIASIKKFSRPVRIEDIARDEANGIDHSCNRLIEVDSYCDVPECLDFCLDFSDIVNVGVNIKVQDQFFLHVGTGGIGLAGCASLDRAYEGEGGALLAGEGGVTVIADEWSYAPTETLIQLGGMSNVVSSAWTAEGAGGVELGGEVESSSTSFSWSGLGGAITSGNASPALNLFFTSPFPGPATLGGEAEVVGSDFAFIDEGDGGVELDGEAFVTSSAYEFGC